MPDTVYWIAGPWPSRLGILPRPRGGDWLDDEMTAWREAGVDVAISLLEPLEEEELALEREEAAATQAGIDFKSFPMPDRGVPRSQQALTSLAKELVKALEAGTNVGIHCRQGIGRSGIVACAVLLASGSDLKSALESIRRARGLEVPETDEQHQWLDRYAGGWN